MYCIMSGEWYNPFIALWKPIRFLCFMVHTMEQTAVFPENVDLSEYLRTDPDRSASTGYNVSFEMMSYAWALDTQVGRDMHASYQEKKRAFESKQNNNPIAILGSGRLGLEAAYAVLEADPNAHVVLFDGAKTPHEFSENWKHALQHVELKRALGLSTHELEVLRNPRFDLVCGFKDTSAAEAAKHYGFSAILPQQDVLKSSVTLPNSPRVVRSDELVSKALESISTKGYMDPALFPWTRDKAGVPHGVVIQSETAASADAKKITELALLVDQIARTYKLEHSSINVVQLAEKGVATVRKQLNLPHEKGANVFVPGTKGSEEYRVLGAMEWGKTGVFAVQYPSPAPVRLQPYEPEPPYYVQTGMLITTPDSLPESLTSLSVPHTQPYEESVAHIRAIQIEQGARYTNADAVDPIRYIAAKASETNALPFGQHEKTYRLPEDEPKTPKDEYTMDMYTEAYGPQVLKGKEKFLEVVESLPLDAYKKERLLHLHQTVRSEFERMFQTAGQNALAYEKATAQMAGREPSQNPLAELFTEIGGRRSRFRASAIRTKTVESPDGHPIGVEVFLKSRRVDSQAFRALGREIPLNILVTHSGAIMVKNEKGQWQRHGRRTILKSDHGINLGFDHRSGFVQNPLPLDHPDHNGNYFVRRMGADGDLLAYVCESMQGEVKGRYIINKKTGTLEVSHDTGDTTVVVYRRGRFLPEGSIRYDKVRVVQSMLAARSVHLERTVGKIVPTGTHAMVYPQTGGAVRIHMSGIASNHTGSVFVTPEGSLAYSRGHGQFQPIRNIRAAHYELFMAGQDGWNTLQVREQKRKTLHQIPNSLKERMLHTPNRKPDMVVQETSRESRANALAQLLVPEGKTYLTEADAIRHIREKISTSHADTISARLETLRTHDGPVFFIVGAGYAGITAAEEIIQAGGFAVIVDADPIPGGLGGHGAGLSIVEKGKEKRDVNQDAMQILEHKNVLYLPETRLDMTDPSFAGAIDAMGFDGVILATGGKEKKRDDLDYSHKSIFTSREYIAAMNQMEITGKIANPEWLVGNKRIARHPDGTLAPVVAIGAGNIAIRDIPVHTQLMRFRDALRRLRLASEQEILRLSAEALIRGIDGIVEKARQCGIPESEIGHSYVAYYGPKGLARPQVPQKQKVMARVNELWAIAQRANASLLDVDIHAKEQKGLKTELVKQATEEIRQSPEFQQKVEENLEKLTTKQGTIFLEHTELIKAEDMKDGTGRLLLTLRVGPGVKETVTMIAGALVTAVGFEQKTDTIPLKTPWKRIGMELNGRGNLIQTKESTKEEVSDFLEAIRKAGKRSNSISIDAMQALAQSVVERTDFDGDVVQQFLSKGPEYLVRRYFLEAGKEGIDGLKKLPEIPTKTFWAN